jgi:hypothetical protein
MAGDLHQGYLPGLQVPLGGQQPCPSGDRDWNPGFNALMVLGYRCHGQGTASRFVAHGKCMSGGGASLLAIRRICKSSMLTVSWLSFPPDEANPLPELWRPIQTSTCCRGGVWAVSGGGALVSGASAYA